MRNVFPGYFGNTISISFSNKTRKLIHIGHDNDITKRWTLQGKFQFDELMFQYLPYTYDPKGNQKIQIEVSKIPKFWS